MSDKPKTLVINTMTESKYMKLSAAGKISDKQLNIVDNDDVGRTVIASYDIVEEKIRNNQLSLNYDTEEKRVQLVNAGGEEQSGFDASAFLKDGMLNGIEYDGNGLEFTVKTDDSEYEKLSVAFVDSQIISASTNAVQGGAVYAGIKSLQAQILGFEEHLNVLDENISAVINTAEDLQEKIDAGSKEVNDTVKVVNSDGIVIYYRVTEENGVKKWEEYNRENAAFIPTENIDITTDNATSEPHLFGAPLAENRDGLSESNDRVPSSKLIGNLLSSKQAQIDAIDGRLGMVENDYVRYTAVPTPALSGRRAIILENGDLITGKTHDGSSDRHLIGIAGSDRDIINVGSEGIQLNLNTSSYDCGPLGTLNAINVNGGTDFVMTNGSMPAAIVGDGRTVDVKTQETQLIEGITAKQLVISTDAESKANSYTQQEISGISAEISSTYQTKADSRISAANFDSRLSDIERDYLKNDDKDELLGEINKKADLSTLIQTSADLSIYVDFVGARAVSTANEYADGISGIIRTDLNDLSGTVMTILSDYALSSEVSSKAELAEKFQTTYDDISAISETYATSCVKNLNTEDQIGSAAKTISKLKEINGIVSAEFADISIDINQVNALSDELCGINGKFDRYYIKSQTSSSSELSDEFAKYQLSGNYALSSDVSQEIASKTVSIQVDAVTEGYLKSYAIYQGGSEIGVIDIPKDFLVKSGDVKTCEQPDTPVSGYVPGDKYLDFVVNVASGEADDRHIYINVKDLTDIYKGADGEEISVGVDSSNNIGAVIKAGAVNREKIADSVYGDISSIASSYVENRVRGLDAETVNGDASKTISKITETDGIVSAEFTDISIEIDQVSGLAAKLDAYALSSDVSGKTDLDLKFGLIENSLSSKLWKNGQQSQSIDTGAAIGYQCSAVGAYSFSEGTKNWSVASYSHAEGDGDNYAGSYSFTIQQVSSDKKTITISPTQDISTIQLSDELIIQNSGSSVVRKISSISYENKQIVLQEKTGTSTKAGSYVMVMHKPWLGYVLRGDGAHAEGYSNMAFEDSHAENIYNAAYGKYSHCHGNANKAGWLGTAFGTGNSAYGNGSIACGGDTATNNKYNVCDTNAVVEATNAFAWSGNGKYEIPAGTRNRTFNINPAAGADGFYIGHRTLPSIIREIVDGRGTGDDSARIIKINEDGETFTGETAAEQFVNTYIDPYKPVYDDEEQPVPKTPDEIKEEAEHLYAMTTEGDDKYNYYGISVVQSGEPPSNSYDWKLITEKTSVAYIKKDGDSDVGPLALSGDLSVNAAQNIKIGQNDLCAIIEDVKKATIECMWNAISAHTVSNGQLKSADQLSVDDIIYSFHDMAANLSSMWAQLNA